MILSKVGGWIVSLLTSAVSYIPGLILTVIITLFVAYHILISWEDLRRKLERLMPFKNNKKILQKFSETSKNIVFGFLLIAIVEFIVSLIGFMIAGISFYAFFAFLIALFAFIPLVGPAIVWIPMAIVLLIQGNYFAFIVVLITGVLLSWLVDTFLMVQIVGKTSKIHPVVLLFGVLGGVKLFGIFGFVIGPLILGFLINLIEVNGMERKR
jgi:predicted PurR-regulated permease PerM